MDVFYEIQNDINLLKFSMPRFSGSSPVAIFFTPSLSINEDS